MADVKGFRKEFVVTARHPVRDNATGALVRIDETQQVLDCDITVNLDALADIAIKASGSKRRVSKLHGGAIEVYVIEIKPTKEEATPLR